MILSMQASKEEVKWEIKKTLDSIQEILKNYERHNNGQRRLKLQLSH